jgi:isochorismate synthase
MSFYDILAKCILADISIALYRLPDDDKIFLIIDKHKASSVGFNDLLRKSEGFVFHSYKMSEKNPVWFIEPSFVIRSDDDSYSEELLSFIDSLKTVSKEDKAIDKPIEKSEYLNKVNDLINILNESDLDKLVYSRTKTIEGKGISHAVEMFKQLESEHDNAFVFFVNITGEISWIGASPELLLSMDEDGMHTMALAGTQACIENDDIMDKVWDNKDIKEQKYVSDYISSQLDSLSCSYDKGRVKTVKAGNICHLQSLYNIDTEDENFWHIIKALHPTPAVCGMPVKEAAKLIDEIETHDRAYYSGFLGPMNIFSNTGMYVNLRSARLCVNRVNLYVGGGITADSNAHKEWEETEMKSKTIINIL